MGSLLSTVGFGGSSSSSSYNSILQCCNGVVDPLTLIAVLGSIVGLTVFLRQAIIDKIPVGRRRREVLSLPQIYNHLKSDDDQTLKHQLYESVVSLGTHLLDEANFHDIITSGRKYLLNILNIQTRKRDTVSLPYTDDIDYGGGQKRKFQLYESIVSFAFNYWKRTIILT